MHWEENCITDREEANAACVALGNRLVEALHLDIPRYELVKEIQVSHLVEIHCRLLNLNFEEYIPTSVPWKPIDDIILSLRQRFGNGTQFDHIDSMLISVREPTHLFCLLQIYETIFNFYSDRGKTFTRPQAHDTTLLTFSDHSNVSQNSGSRTELDLQIEVLQNRTGDENVEIHQWQETSRHHRVLVNVPKLPDSSFATNRENEHHENELPIPLLGKKEKRIKGVNTLETSHRAKDFRDKSDGHEKSADSIPVQKLSRRTRKEFKSKRTKSRVSPTEDKRPPRIESSFIQNEAGAVDYNKEVMDFHREIQQHVRNELYMLEEEMKSLKSKDTCTSNLPQLKVRYDVFGKPIRERFPYYPNGIIWPRCSSSSQPLRKRLLQNGGQTEDNHLEKNREFLHEMSDADGENFIDEGDGKEMDDESLTFSRQIIERILVQHPYCVFTPTQLESLRRTCEEYIKLFDQDNLREEDLRTKVQEKMEILFRLAVATNEKVNLLGPSESKPTQSSNLTTKNIERRRRKSKKDFESVTKKKSESGRHKITFKMIDSLPERKISQEVLQLEEEYLNLLTAFRVESQRLKANVSLPSGEKEARYKELWNNYHLRMKASIDACVDKVITRIGLIYST